MLLHLKVILLAVILNSNGTYYKHEYIEVPGTIIECEEDKPEDKYLPDGKQVRIVCMIISGA